VEEIKPRRQSKTAGQIDVKETGRCQIRNGDIRKHGATGGVLMTT
jgi:hypothetical protein